MLRSTGFSLSAHGEKAVGAPWSFVDEHLLRRGPGAALDALLQLHHRSMLARLADTVENSPP